MTVCAYLVNRIHAPIVYRLGHEAFNLRSGVRFPVGVLPKKLFDSAAYSRLPVHGQEAKP